MRKQDFAMFSAVTVVTGFVTVSCTQTPASLGPALSVNGVDPEATVALTISAAASVQDAMREVQTAYEAENSGVVITYNFGSSGSLAQQIVQGAPADVFLSASKQWMDELDDQGQILPASRQDLLLNSLVLIAPLNKVGIDDFGDIATDKVKRIAIGEPESVPAGGYAKEALTSLNLFDALQPKMVFAKDVRQVLSYVTTGNVEAGVVYATDAKVSDGVQILTTAPADTHSAIVYPVGAVADSTNADAAQAFIDFLDGEEAIAIFENYGFTMAE